MKYESLARPDSRPRIRTLPRRLKARALGRALALSRALALGRTLALACALLPLVLFNVNPALAARQRTPRRRFVAATRAADRAGTRNGRADTGPARAARRKPSAPASRLAPQPAPQRAEIGEDPEGREAWLQFKRAYPFGEIPVGARRAAWAARPKSARPAPLSAQTLRQVWTPIGPAPTLPPPTPQNWGGTSGRINAVAVSPANPQLILVGASTGGIWRSADGGATFAPVSDDQVDLAVGSIAFAPSDPSVVYAGMGDVDYSYLGSGVLKSTNGGQTWMRVSNSTLPDGIVARLEVDPTNPQRVYVAQTVTIERATNTTAASGVFVSTDGGVSWTKKLEGQARDVVLHPTDPRTVYACTAPRTPTGGQPSTAGGLFRSTDGGETWAGVPVNVAGFHSSFWDFRVAVTPADPQRLYAFYGTLFSGERRLSVSRDGGATWQQNNLSQVDTGQFGYNTYLAVDPANADTVYLGSHDVWKSTDGGLSFTNLTKNFAPSGGGWLYQPGSSSLHPDQQAFAFQPGNSSVVYLANDGGLWKSTDGGATVQSLNRTGLSLVQFNSLALHPTDGGTTVGGTQDNGTQRRVKDASGVSTFGWADFSGSDGGATFFNPLNPDVLFGTYYAAWVLRFKVTPSVVFFDKQIGSFDTWGETDTNTRIAFYPPFVGNGVNQRIYFGTWRLFISNNLGDTWTAPAGFTDLTKGGRDVLNAIAVARSDLNVIYTGSVQGRAMTSADGGATWRDATAGLPNRAVERIVVDPANSSLAYLCVSGYGTGHVFKTQDAGQTWADVSGNLPNVPTSALLIDPLNAQTIYAGTDVGVFRSTTGGNVWETFNDGLPPVIITAFAAQPGGRIQVATYGRGAYELVTREVAEPTLAFGASSYTASEGAGRAAVTITRAGDTSAAATVDVRTVDDARAVRCDDNAGAGGAAFARCDYATTVQTVTFAAGETQKIVNVPVIDDSFVEPDESVQLALSNPTGGTLGSPVAATVVIRDNDSPGAQNPILTTDFFVRQQYLDFLSREPEAGQPWSAVINNCAPNDTSCDRISVSANFFRSQEFQLKGLFVFRFYKVAFNRLPLYTEIVADMSSVTGATTAEVQQKKAAFTSGFAQRQPFKTLYDATTSQQFVDALMSRHSLQSVTTPNPATPDDLTSKIALTRADLVSRLNAATMTRAQVLRAIADSNEVGAAEFNPAFVAMQYFGYLRRDPDTQGYAAWLATINANPNDFRSMVNGFMNSEEYRLRFGAP